MVSKTKKYTLKVDAWQILAIEKALESFRDRSMDVVVDVAGLLTYVRTVEAK